jgi:DNA-binding NtrC family response regulator
MPLTHPLAVPLRRYAWPGNVLELHNSIQRQEIQEK